MDDQNLLESVTQRGPATNSIVYCKYTNLTYYFNQICPAENFIVLVYKYQILHHFFFFLNLHANYAMIMHSRTHSSKSKNSTSTLAYLQKLYLGPFSCPLAHLSFHLSVLFQNDGSSSIIISHHLSQPIQNRTRTELTRLKCK